jgi:hypothetical protein
MMHKGYPVDLITHIVSVKRHDDNKEVAHFRALDVDST